MKISRTLGIILFIIANIAIDQISKVIVASKMVENEVIEVFSNNFLLKYVKNPGAFLGMGSDSNDIFKLVFLKILPVIVLSYVVYYVLKTKYMNRLNLIAFCCIIGGGISNVFDRIAYGKVTDFLYIELTDNLHTGIFNLADVSVTTGMLILLFTAFSKKKKSIIA